MGARLGVQRAVTEGQAIERALFWGRIAGGAVILILGTFVSPSSPDVAMRGLGVYFIAYAWAMLAITGRAGTAQQRQRAAWLGHAFDTAGFLAALVLNASETVWIVVYAAPLYLIVASSRMGALGGITASVALAATHVALALWRDQAGIAAFDPARELTHVAIYGLAALLTTAIDIELRTLRRAHDLQMLRELERTQRLESVGALAGGIAHDLNNVLAVIRTDAYLALSGDGDADRARRSLEEIRDAAESGAGLTRQLLVFARGTRSSARERVDVPREIRYAERLLRRTIGAGIALEVNVADDAPSVILEPGQLEAIVMNLVVNSRDAMPGGGRIDVTVDGVEQITSDGGLRPGRYLRLVVTDQGGGMSAEVARHVFEPFFTTKAKGRGTGLGLWSVHGVARRAGGAVSIVSSPGNGTTVTVQIPAAAEAVETAPARRAHVEVA